MLAKLSVWGETRTLALAALQQALAQCQIFGLPSNIRFLEQLTAHPVVQQAEIDTGYLDKHLEQVLAVDHHAPVGHRLAAAYFSFIQSTAGTGRPAGQSPWAAKDFWRLHGQGAFRINLKQRDMFEPYLIRMIGAQLELEAHGQVQRANLIAQDDSSVCLEINGRHHAFHHFRHRDELVVHDGQSRTHWQVLRAGSSAKDLTTAQDGFIRAPMPGKLVLLKVQAKQEVAKGEELAIMEAMKMELSIKAPCAGTINECLAKTGSVLDADAPILSWLPSGD
ncbi:MAG: hypothetical protein KAZ45_03270 [Arenimonas sp.]|nr:hypothetical protein [Arenimonas sp.]